MSKKKARTTKKLNATNQELKRTLAVVRGQLTKSETKLTKATGKAERWKKEAAAQRRAASRSGVRVEKLQKKLGRAAAALEPIRAPGPMEAAASGGPVAEPTAADGVTGPDETWSVVQLRAEARARGSGRDVQQTEGAAARRSILSGAWTRSRRARSTDRLVGGARA